jgi:hypothetical protein
MGPSLRLLVGCHRQAYQAADHDPPRRRDDAYFHGLAGETGIPYQTLINLYLRECAATHKRLDLNWWPAPRGD